MLPSHPPDPELYLAGTGEPSLRAHTAQRVVAVSSRSLDRATAFAASWEATALARFVGEGRTESPVHTLDETVSILATIDQARAQLEGKP